MNNLSACTCSAILVFFIFLITLLTHPIALAENTDDPNNREIEEMIVVAHHTPTPASLVGSSTSVLDAEDFSNRITFDPAALFRSLPSLNVSQTGPFGGLTEVRLRGNLRPRSDQDAANHHAGGQAKLRLGGPTFMQNGDKT